MAGATDTWKTVATNFTATIPAGNAVAFVCYDDFGTLGSNGGIGAGPFSVQTTTTLYLPALTASYHFVEYLVYYPSSGAGSSPVYGTRINWVNAYDYTQNPTPPNSGHGNYGKVDGQNDNLTAGGQPTDYLGAATTAVSYHHQDTLTNTLPYPVTITPVIQPLDASGNPNGPPYNGGPMTLAPGASQTVNMSVSTPFSLSFTEAPATGTVDGVPVTPSTMTGVGGVGGPVGTGTAPAAGTVNETSTAAPSVPSSTAQPSAANVTRTSDTANTALEANDDARNQELRNEIQRGTAQTKASGDSAHTDALGTDTILRNMSGTLADIDGKTGTSGSSGAGNTTEKAMEDTLNAIRADGESAGSLPDAVTPPSGWADVPGRLSTVYSDLKALGLGFDPSAVSGGSNLQWGINVMGSTYTLDVGSVLGDSLGFVRGGILTVALVAFGFSALSIVRSAFSNAA